MLKILYVDDSQTSLDLASMSLKDKPHRLVYAGNGFDGIAEMKRQPPDVVISDLNMPGMNGWEFLERAKGICPQALRVLVSITETYDYLMREMPRRSALFDLFLEKPYTKQGWNDAIDRIVDHRETHFIYHVSRHQETGAACLDLKGDIDSSSEAAFMRAIDHFMAREGAPRLILDLGQVTFLGQACLQFLAQASVKARERGGGIALVRPTKAVKALFLLSGSSSAFRFHSTSQEAQGSFLSR